MASNRSELPRASSNSSTCLGVSGPTVSSRSRWMAMLMLVRGVFNSWLTVATRSLLNLIRTGGIG